MLFFFFFFQQKVFLEVFYSFVKRQFKTNDMRDMLIKSDTDPGIVARHAVVNYCFA